MRVLRTALLVALLAVAGVVHAAELRVHFVDVGQGDAALVVSPEGKTVLVDAGPRGADDEVLEVLGREDVDRLDLAVGTHAHADHIGGMREVLQRVRARFFMDPGWDHGSATYSKLLAALERLGIPVRLARAGRTVDIGGGATFTILAPEEPLLTDTRSDVNANSVVARLEWGEVSVLFTGDAEGVTERRLLKSGGELNSTILKVAHHGSRHSTSARFLRKVSPEAAVISCGDNSYGHPTDELLSRLEQRDLPVWRTDRHGTVRLVITDGEEWHLESERSASTDPDVEPEAARAPPGDSGVVYASRNSSVYHEPECNRGLEQIKPKNKKRYDSAEEAKAAGLRHAKCCLP
ncbi:MAG: ComEC/Rec2 family competence protein [Myxococcota bacterium]